ncbi:MAG: hypothetical protein H7301_09065 [Cryobacterium sp.]|nr:hypothetical protein [Oligoflexia bacterium]
MTVHRPSSSREDSSFLRIGYPVAVFFAALFAWNSTGETALSSDASLSRISQMTTTAEAAPDSSRELVGQCTIRGSNSPNLAQSKSRSTDCFPSIVTH